MDGGGGGGEEKKNKVRSAVTRGSSVFDGRR